MRIPSPDGTSAIGVSCACIKHTSQHSTVDDASSAEISSPSSFSSPSDSDWLSARKVAVGAPTPWPTGYGYMHGCRTCQRHLDTGVVHLVNALLWTANRFKRVISAWLSVDVACRWPRNEKDEPATFLSSALSTPAVLSRVFQSRIFQPAS